MQRPASRVRVGRTGAQVDRRVFVARGFRALSDSIVQKGSRRITVVVENRDHGTNPTFSVVAVTTTRAPAAGRVALRRQCVGRSVAAKGAAGGVSVTITGARVWWTVRTLPGVARPSVATLREARSGRSGPVMVHLGSRYHACGCTAIPAALGQSIAARPSGPT
jgi:hypothetical protein